MSTPNHDSDDLARRLRNQLQSDASSMDVPDGDLDAVVTRGRRTRIAAVGGAVAVALVVGVGAWAGVERLLDPPPQVVIDQPSDTASPTPPETSSPTPETSPDATSTPTPEATPTPGPDAPPDPTPETSSAPTSAPTSTPEPTPEATSTGTPTQPTDTDEPLVAGPLLVAATDDGIVAWSDGAATPVPGVDGPVDQAFDDGRGGVVFQRNDRGIGRLVDGRIQTLVALGEFDPRTFEDASGEAEVPVRLELHDVDPVAGRIAFSVHYGQDPSAPQAAVPFSHAVDVTADLGGTDRRELGDRFTYEEGASLSIAAGRVLYRAEYLPGSGELQLSEGADLVDLGWDATFPGDGADVGETESFLGAQLDRAGQDVAYLRAVRQTGFTLVVRDVVGGEIRTELDVNDRATFITRLDFDGTSVVLWGESDQVDVLDLDTGDWTTATLPGVRSVTTGLAADDTTSPAG